MAPKEITFRGKLLQKLEKNIDGLTIKDFKKDKNIDANEHKILKNLNDLVEEGKVSKEITRRLQDRRKNIVYKAVV